MKEKYRRLGGRESGVRENASVSCAQVTSYEGDCEKGSRVESGLKLFAEFLNDDSLVVRKAAALRAGWSARDSGPGGGPGGSVASLPKAARARACPIIPGLWREPVQQNCWHC